MLNFSYTKFLGLELFPVLDFFRFVCDSGLTHFMAPDFFI